MIVAAPPLAVQEHLADGARVGKAHRVASGRAPAPPGRNRRRYRVACGRNVLRGMSVTRIETDGVCRSCYPDWRAGCDP